MVLFSISGRKCVISNRACIQKPKQISRWTMVSTTNAIHKNDRLLHNLPSSQFIFFSKVRSHYRFIWIPKNNATSPHVAMSCIFKEKIQQFSQWKQTRNPTIFVHKGLILCIFTHLEYLGCQTRWSGVSILAQESCTEVVFIMESVCKQ